MRLLAIALTTLIGLPGWAVAGDDPPAKKLAMMPAVACESIAGFEDYVPLDEVVLTRDDKLLIYYRPIDFQHEQVGKEFRVHLVQDARLHKRGAKAVLQSKDKMVDYKGTFKGLPISLFLSNTVALKPLPPGEYDLEIILHDEIGKGPAASQILPFRVCTTDEKVKAKEAKEKEKEKAEVKKKDS